MGESFQYFDWFQLHSESVFLDKYRKFSTINTDQDPLKIFNFFVKNVYLIP
jgi:hypothetical protein